MLHELFYVKHSTNMAKISSLHENSNYPTQYKSQFLVHLSARTETEKRVKLQRAIWIKPHTDCGITVVISHHIIILMINLVELRWSSIKTLSTTVYKNCCCQICNNQAMLALASSRWLAWSTASWAHSDYSHNCCGVRLVYALWLWLSLFNTLQSKNCGQIVQKVAN